MRSKGKTVFSNDKNYSSYIYSSVFVNGFNQSVVDAHILQMNNLPLEEDWLTQNYSGVKFRKSKRKDSKDGTYPMLFTTENAKKIDAARNYVENIKEETDTKNALIFACILAADKSMNNTSDQKSSFKNWLPKALKPVEFVSPTNVPGPKGKAYCEDIINNNIPKDFDTVYLDPPYSNGVLYSSCYHVNDSIGLWDKPTLDHSYSMPRPKRASFANIKGGRFYSKTKAEEDFSELMETYKNAKRIILSYSDAPKNLISIDVLKNVSKKFGEVEVVSKEHKICTQFNKQNKQIDQLKEYFIIIDI